jgi:hypothetical protein
MDARIKAMIIPYKNFKERIRLTKKYLKNYYIENLDGYLYLVRREKEQVI